MIHKDLVIAATALTEIASISDAEMLAKLVPLFATGLVMCQRSMLAYLWDVELDIDG
jgi:hypothetical protein